MERDPATMLVAKNIEALMKARDLDPTRLAKAAGLNQTAVRDILIGKSKSPTVKTVGKIATALGVPVSSIFEEAEALDLRSDFLMVFESLSDARKELLLQTARAWLPPQEQRA